jgi:catechol 2,3-dioxygenase-like lactoylglutathione lyase family enzyme
VGVGSESTHFALELTYNYGIDSYLRGNDLRHIAVRRAAVRDASAVHADGAGRQMMVSPDGYSFMVVDASPLAGAQPDDPFLFVSLHVSDLDAAITFYRDVLKATIVDAASVPGGERNARAVHARFAPDTPGVELVQLPAGVKLDRAIATGRFATETEDGAPEKVAALVTAHGQGTCVLHGPLKLQPHGEEVAIVQDGDGHEYCFVDARGYRNCIAVTQREGGTTVDWSYRERLSKAAALQGEAAKTGVAAVLAGDYDVAKISAMLDGLVTSAPVVIFSQTSCPFCKKAKKLLSETLGVNAPKLKVVECDTLGADGYALRVELAKRTGGRSSVPNIFIGGASVGGFADGPGVNTLHEQGKLQDMLRKAGAL